MMASSKLRNLSRRNKALLALTLFFLLRRRLVKLFKVIFGLNRYRSKEIEFLRADQREEDIVPIPTPYPPKHKFAGLFLGHFADTRPWQKDYEFFEELLKKRDDWYEEAKERFGEDTKTFQVNLAGETAVYTCDVDIVGEILGHERDLFRGSDAIRIAWRDFFPLTTIVLEHEPWLKIRGILTKTMNRMNFDDLPKITSEKLNYRLDSYIGIHTKIKTVPLFDCLMVVGFDSFHKFIYDYDFNLVYGENLDVFNDCLTIARNISYRLILAFPLLWKLPTAQNRKLREASDRIKKFSLQFVENKLKEMKQPVTQKSKNLLEAFIEAAREEAENGISKLSKLEFRDNLAGLMFGGFDTTISSTNQILTHLAGNQIWQDRLHEELKAVDISRSSLKELEQVEALSCTIKESLRYQGILVAPIRIPYKDVMIKNYLIEKGTQINCDHHRMARCPEYWPGNTRESLMKYDPSRWLNGFEPHKNAFMPFGFGGRACAGQKIGTAQLHILIAGIIKRYKVKYDPNNPVKMSFGMGRTVAPDTTLIFEKRETS